MLESISESAVRITEPVNNQLNVNNRVPSLQKTLEVINERPVVATQEASNTESDTDQKAGSYDSDDEGIFYEKYDDHGDVICRIPHVKINVDESV